MFEKPDAKSLAITVLIVALVAFVTAFVVAWAQRLLIGETHSTLTTLVAVGSAFVVVMARHKRKSSSDSAGAARN